MLTKDNWQWSGSFDLALHNTVTGASRLIEVTNLLTDGGLNWLRDRMQGRSTEYFTEIALGTDGRAAQGSDQALYGEVLPRKPVIISQPETGVSLCDAFWSETEANVHIRELGIYAGPILVARAVVDVEKTSQESLTVTRRDILKRTSGG